MCMTFSYCCIVSAHNSMMLKYFYLNITLDHPSPFPRFSFSVFQSCPAYDCLPFQTQIQPQPVEPGKGCATIGSKVVPPFQPTKRTHFNPLHIIRKARLVLFGLVLHWIRAWSISSHHHLMLGCTGERKREGLNSWVQKREGAKGTFPAAAVIYVMDKLTFKVQL